MAKSPDEKATEKAANKQTKSNELYFLIGSSAAEWRPDKLSGFDQLRWSANSAASPKELLRIDIVRANTRHPSNNLAQN